MPGSIHVSILELVGLPSSLQSSSMGIKVSVGKQAHETHEKGDCSFSLASLRDTLKVSIHDAEGNEVAHTGVEIRSIVEKGTWDDLFPLQGGGKVHMKLHFILTEDEQNRIRSMRESAARKKQEDLLKRSHSSSELAVASGGSPASSQDSLKTAHQSAGSNAKILSKVHPGQKKQDFSTSKSTGALDKLLVHQHLRKAIASRDQEQQSPLDKTPSNVRKMILAFESNPVEEALPATNKTRATPHSSSSTQLNVPPKAPSLKKTRPVNLETAPAPTTPKGLGQGRGKLRDYGTSYQEKLVQKKPDQSKDLRVQTIYLNMSSEKNISKMQPAKEEKPDERKSPKKMRRSSIYERSKFSWESSVQAFPSRKRSADLFTKQQGAIFSDPFVHGKNWRSKHWKASQHTAESKVYGNDHCFSNSFRRWVFLDESICSCIPIDDRPSVGLLEDCPSHCSRDTSQLKLEDTGVVPSNDEKSSAQSRNSESSSRQNNRETTPIGQAMKIAIMVGFGLLVFLTRQRK